MLILVRVATNKSGSDCEDEIEVDDDATEEQIEADAREAMFNMIEWSWSKVEEGEEE